MYLHDNCDRGTIIYDNLLTRNNDITPQVDIYAAGFPCQPFSSNYAERQGFDDERGEVFFGCVEYSEKRRPTAFIFENVPPLSSTKDKLFVEYLKP